MAEVGATMDSGAPSVVCAVGGRMIRNTSVHTLCIYRYLVHEIPVVFLL